MARYRFKSGSRHFSRKGLSPDVAGSELARLQEEHGELTPVHVVDAARPPEAPLHPAFEWDDGVAGECYRQIQASNLIRTVEVIQSEAPEAHTEPAYVEVSAQRQAYQPVIRAVQQEDLYEAAFSRACERLQEAQRDLERLLEVARRLRRPELQRYADAARVISKLQSFLVRG